MPIKQAPRKAKERKPNNKLIEHTYTLIFVYGRHQTQTIWFSVSEIYASLHSAFHFFPTCCMRNAAINHLEQVNTLQSYCVTKIKPQLGAEPTKLGQPSVEELACLAWLPWLACLGCPCWLSRRGWHGRWIGWNAMVRIGQGGLICHLLQWHIMNPYKQALLRNMIRADSNPIEQLSNTIRKLLNNCSKSKE